MWRVLARSFTEPLRSVGPALTLAGATLALWFLFVLAVLVAERVEYVPWMMGDMTRWITAFMVLPVLLLTLPVIGGEAKDRTLLLNLMQPIPRVTYYSGRVLGRGLFAAAYFAFTLVVLHELLRWVGSAVFDGGEPSPFPPDLAWRITFTGLSLVSMVLSLCALAPVSSTRYGHAVYWAGMYIVVVLARDLHATPEATALQRGFSTVVLELLQPFLVGADPRFVRDAALGSWHLQRPLAQWAFGVALAYLVGVLAFSRMEVARKS